VVKLLLSPVADASPPGRVVAASITPIPRPVYRIRENVAPTPRLAALVAAPPVPERKPRRTGLLLAACVAALAFLGAFAPTALLRPSTRLPLATVPIAPAMQKTIVRSIEAPASALAYRVQAGDTLWSIAGSLLGDAQRWRDVWRTNAGRMMLDGSRFVDPNLIQPGWRLRLPER
jgi:nucleoid-associated protein YgaU